LVVLLPQYVNLFGIVIYSFDFARTWCRSFQKKRRTR